jgi:hypothetical protein
MPTVKAYLRALIINETLEMQNIAQSVNSFLSTA